ncbi:MAG: hypothetical protein VSS75_003730 [Candidatus Parabeggiatoa sp.]|nr:hypothetical protein [Candidatus Parabeggiatoa sp.]
MPIMNRFFKILRTMLGVKADKALSQEMSEALNDAAIMEKLAKKPTQQTILNDFYHAIDNIALELSNVSTKKDRQKALLNRLDMMLEKLNNDDNIPSILPSTIVSIKRQYLDSLSSDEILDWLKKYRLFILAEDYSKQVQKIKKKALSKRLENPNDSLQWLKDNLDNMSLAEVNVFFDWYHKNGKKISELLQSQAQEIVRQGKQKMLAKIRQETTEEASKLVLNPPELRKLLSGEDTRLVGTGANGIVLESKQANTVIKISHSGDTERNLLREVNNHADFLNAILSGKLARTPDGNQCIPDWVHVPDIYQKPNLVATEVRKQAYIMEQVTGITLKRWVYLKRDEYQSKLEPFTEQEIRSLSEVEFEKLVEIREGEMLTYYNIYPEEGELLPEVFFQAFPNDSKKTAGLEHALKYLRDEHHLVHPDLHWKNILIDHQENIYLIDFG